ncbi:hypothetical protein H5410_028272, partial [Solanum commersonii]
MDESFNYNEHFEKCFSPAISDVSPHPILEFYRESWREKKSGIENVDLIDDAQSKLQLVGQNSQMEKEYDIITNLNGYEPKLQGSAKLVDKVLDPTMILGREGSEPKLQGFAELVDKVLPSLIQGDEGSELKQQGSFEHVNELLTPSMIRGSEDDVKEKRKRRNKQSNNVKDDVKEKRKRKKKQSSNVDDDSWLPAGWLKIVRYRKTGKLVGYSYN